MFDEEKFKREYMKMQKRRKAGIVGMSVLLIIALLAIGFISVLLISGRNLKDIIPGYNTVSEQSTDDGNDNDTGKNKNEEEQIPDDEALDLSDEQMHRGRLILVNSEYPYDFDANAGVELWSLSEISDFQFPMSKSDFQVAQDIYTNLVKIMEDCNEAIGASDTAISSAYRSYEYQQQVYDDTVAEYGEQYAAEYVAKPGYSEHHTGYAVDFGCIGKGGETSFSESNNAVWMDENCYLYGFIRRYQEDKVDITGISNEAWHFRYVGTCHATFMYENNMCLEEYLDFLKTRQKDNPLDIETNIGTYRVWYTGEKRIREPEHEYVVSGNNIDGYIITENITGE